MLWKTVATHRLKELRHLHTVKKLAAWRRNNGFDQCDERDEQWVHSEHVGRSERVTEGILDVRKIQIKAEGRGFP